jgi:NTE family protein
LNRVNEITFNSSLLKELRSIDFVSRLLEEGAINPERYRKLRVHIVHDHKHMARMGASSKYNAEMAFLEELFDHGREAASAWLESHFDDIGVRATVDLRAMFQGISAGGHHG